jgi:hypothetical protein
MGRTGALGVGTATERMTYGSHQTHRLTRRYLHAHLFHLQMADPLIKHTHSVVHPSEQPCHSLLGLRSSRSDRGYMFMQEYCARGACAGGGSKLTHLQLLRFCDSGSQPRVGRYHSEPVTIPHERRVPITLVLGSVPSIHAV